jgi:transposase
LVTLGEVVMILDLRREGMSISAIARRVGLDRKTVRRYIDRGLEPPAYGPRERRETKVKRFERYIGERLAAFPELTATRLLREVRALGYGGG